MTDAFYPAGLPGQKTRIQNSPRRVMLGHERYVEGGIILDGSEGRDLDNTDDTDTWRHGLVLGKVTSGGRYAPFAIGVLPEDYTHALGGSSSSGDDGTTLTLTAALATEVQRRIGSSGNVTLIGPPTASGTVASQTVAYSSVDTSGGTLTITDPGVDFVAGSFLCAADGSETPLGLLDRDRKITDISDNDVDVPANLIIGGSVAKDGPIPYPTNAKLLTWLKSKLNGGDGTTRGGGLFTFADDFAAS